MNKVFKPSSNRLLVNYFEKHASLLGGKHHFDKSFYTLTGTRKFIVFKMITEQQKQSFWREVGLMQQRHSIFFPVEHLQYIQLVEVDARPALKITEGHQLPSVILMEIELAFKFTML